ncbi:bifunctional adenosylcobinamide kinase/adenosylcobinamide-phosphate guanylyltransferase [Aestuariirhabdus sp. Z084]|uniref:bifunctional adenosylcobinamide kinase/adenosylcobinamide-phosphate guanylyltransferase n=1 Tax=Aestuariirhabdus haliotis TaxID=2918751 RepID=UPI00201B4635|nr:bifunctional adenosylcobinamide kinase/adenosylcobinamide-phosphate guanylyltransferase [Aestuariirhabdus haliotis]MCL6414730.1 bifunctional adenosylcobinamide kinase/adenosylcobinamide-phosphate guanylyltransferase [Aestuariirhabdus haliotis]MCL6418662.1 bifunctional adenosylcobinamide kinase/adenosylcobinamide-phosphate guanylyltransferase [Aestuariirhabdus haliotis]
MFELILGGVRSGKSQLAEQRLTSGNGTCGYIATADSAAYQDDASFRDRINLHRQRRPDHWELIEEPLYLARAIEHSSADRLLVDCLGVWLTNLLLKKDPLLLQQEQSALVATLESNDKDVILVSSEVGFGVIPMGDLSRDFVDQLGLFNQQLAAKADKVWLSIAGLAQQLK